MEELIMTKLEAYLELLKKYTDHYNLMKNFIYEKQIGLEYDIIFLIYRIKDLLTQEERAIFDEVIKTNIIPYACPIEDEFVAYKLCTMKRDSNSRRLVKLLIPADARRSSAFGTKCKCDKAKVLEITDLHTEKACKVAYSFYDSNFRYTVGEIISVENFDENRWDECRPGIHFFIDKEEACKYRLCIVK